MEKIDRRPDLDAPCGKNLTYRSFIQCGETQARTNLANLPKELDSYLALSRLASRILDPVWDRFGPVRLTYGFSSHELIKKIPDRIAPGLDQHAAHERNSIGNFICKRLGAACDFHIPGQDMQEVATWVFRNTPVDRIYFYGSDKPIHVSCSEQPAHQFVDMLVNPKNNRRTPRVRRVVWDTQVDILPRIGSPRCLRIV